MLSESATPSAVVGWILKSIHARYPYISSTQLKDAIDNSPDVLVEFTSDVSTNNLVIVQIDQVARNVHSVMSSIHAYNPDFTSFIVYKTTASESLTSTNMNDVLNILFIHEMPLSSLKSAMHTIYAPLLLQSPLDPKLRTLVSDLKSQLSLELNTKDLTERDVTSIKSIDEEILFWKTRSEEMEPSHPHYTRTKAICRIYAPLHHSFLQLRQGDMASDAIEDISHVINALWHLDVSPYLSQERIHHVLDLLSSEIATTIERSMSFSHLFLSEYKAILMSIGMDVCHRWKEMTLHFTSVSWPHDMHRSWSGGVYRCTLMNRLIGRLEKVSYYRNVMHALDGLCQSHSENVGSISQLAMFLDVGYLLKVDDNSEQMWQMLLVQFEKHLSKVEEQASRYIIQSFSEIKFNPQILFKEIERNVLLMNRPIMVKKLTGEKSAVIKLVIQEIENILMPLKKQQSTRNIKKNFDIVLWCSLRLQRIYNQFEFIKQVDFLDKDISEYLSNCISQHEEYRDDALKGWIADTTKDLGCKSTTSGKLLELDQSTGRLLVNYDDSLLQFQKEIRQLLAMGFHIPEKLQKVSLDSNKLKRYTITLKQIAYFYNTIDQQMLPFQQPMFLKKALAFEKVIKDPSKHINIEVANHEDIQKYIQTLKSHVEDINSTNLMFRKHHDDILVIIKQLHALNLYTEQLKWKSLINSIRVILNTAVEKYSLKAEDTLEWRIQLDKELYNALDHQYQKTLATFHDTLPETLIEISIKQGSITTHPEISIIKTNYLKDLKKLVHIPNLFKGVGDSKTFPEILKSHKGVSKDAESNVKSFLGCVEEHVQRFTGLMNVDQINNEEDYNLITYKDKLTGFKNMFKEIEAFPNTKKLGNVVFSLVAFKNSIGFQLQSSCDVLVEHLRKSIVKDITRITNFVEEGVELLTKLPVTISEIGQAKSSHDKMLQKRSTLSQIIIETRQKNTLLKDTIGIEIDFEELHGKWNKLNNLLDGHSAMVQAQVSSIKQNVSDRKLKLQEEIHGFSANWAQIRPMNQLNINFQDPSMSRVDIEFITKEFSVLSSFKEEITAECQYFNTDMSFMIHFEKIEREVKDTCDSWIIINDFLSNLGFLTIEIWMSLRYSLHKIDDFVDKWKKSAQALSNKLYSSMIFNELDVLQKVLPILKLIRGDNWTTEHWAHLFHLLNINNVQPSSITFGRILESRQRLDEKFDDIKKLNERVIGEMFIREVLQKLELWSATSCFKFSVFINNQGHEVNVIHEWRELMTDLEDLRSLLQSCKESSFYANFSDQVGLWDTRLTAIEQCLLYLNKAQRKWIYLEPVFVSKSLPKDAYVFYDTRATLLQIYHSLKRDNRVVSILSTQNICKELGEIVEQLDRCQKILKSYLEDKRIMFPRFYFISDEDLLELLGNPSNVGILQAHIRKLFEGVSKLLFSENNQNVIGIESPEGEQFILNNPISINSQTEKWLQALLVEIESSLNATFCQYVLLSKIPNSAPAQINILIEAIKFTTLCEQSISSKSLKSLCLTYEKRLNEMTKTENITQTKVNKLKSVAIIQDLIKYITILQDLLEKDVIGISDWAWKKQLRYYFINGRPIIRIGNSEFQYSFDYQGISEKLVYTKLTEKCFGILANALSSGLGGNPYGPAGTGKTETIKSLGQHFGRQVFVFNCDESMDYFSIARILTGTMRCGAWICFDEFNRLEETVLSATSGLIMTIQSALKEKQTSVTLLGSSITLNLNTGIFVTLNPASKEYKGRVNLPENIKNLFRPIAMILPDIQTIVLVILKTLGFQNSKLLSEIIVEINRQSSLTFPNHRHYEWGLRPLKSVLRLVSDIKSHSIDDLDENSIIIQAMFDVFLSRLNHSDAQHFQNIVQSAFKRQVNRTSDSFLQEAIKKSYAELRLVENQFQSERVNQLHHALEAKIGAVIYGSVGSGKTTLWKVLERCWKYMGKKLEVFVLNPKSMNREMFIGNLDSQTREWKDGVLTYLCRKASNRSFETHSWIIFDGKIDPEWIEALNSVLDDNKLLTLPTGERISLDKNVNMIFETYDISDASPATISRLSVILNESIGVELKEIVQNLYDSVSESSAVIDMINEVLPRITFGSYQVNLTSAIRSEGNHLNATYLSLAALLNESDRTKFLVKFVKYGTTDKFHAKSLSQILSSQMHFAVINHHTEIRHDLEFTYTDFAPSVMFYHISLSMHSTVTDILPLILSKCTVKDMGSSKVLSSNNSKRICFVFDYLESVSPDKWATVQIEEFLHFTASCNQIWISDCDKLTLKDIQFCINLPFSATRRFSRLLSSIAVLQMNTLISRDQDFNSDIDKEMDFILKSLPEGVRKTLKLNLDIRMPKHIKNGQLSAFIPCLVNSFSPFISNNPNDAIEMHGSKLFSSYFNCDHDPFFVSYQQYKTLVEASVIQYCREVSEICYWGGENFLKLLSALEISLATPKRNLILYGTSNDERIDMCRLACFRSNIHAEVIHWGPIDGEKKIERQLKDIIQKVLVEDTSICIIIQENLYDNKKLFKQLTSILVSGDISSIFKQQEIIQISGSIEASSKKNIIQERLDSNIHLVLLLNSSQTTFSHEYPGLYQQCSVLFTDCILQSLSDRIAYLEAASKSSSFASALEIDSLNDFIIKVSPVIAKIKNHQLKTIDLFSIVKKFHQLYSKRLSSVTSLAKNLSDGLKTVDNAFKSVQKLSDKAKLQELELKVQQNSTEDILANISEAMESSSRQKSEIEKLRSSLVSKEADLVNQKKLIEIELETVEPQLKKAKEAVGNIKPEALTEIRSMRSPPNAIRDVLECVLRLMGCLDMTWNTMKSFLGKRSIKEEIINFDAHKMTKEVRIAVEELVSMKSDSFEESSIKRVSIAAAPLALWVKANLLYASVLERISPLESSLRALDDSYSKITESLRKYENDIQSVNETVETLKIEFAHKTRSSEILRIDFLATTRTLESAEKLLTLMGGEYQRWKSRLLQLEESKSYVSAQCFAASILLNITGSLSDKDRILFKKDISTALGIQEFDMGDVLSTEAEYMKWHTAGLPDDIRSLENALIILNTYDNPLIIDTTDIIKPWLISTFDTPYEVASSTAPKLSLILESCIRLGKKLIIENIEDIPPQIIPLLRGDYKIISSRRLISLFDKDIDVNENFKLYLFTKSKYSGLYSSCVNIVDFSMNKERFETITLGDIMSVVSPEINTQRKSRIQQQSILTQELKDIEAQMLSELSILSDSFLDNPKVINYLQEAKEKGQMITATLNESKKLYAAYKLQMDRFSASVNLLTKLYFSIKELKQLNVNYSFSYTEIRRLFIDVVKSTPFDQDDIESFNRILNAQAIISIYNLVSRVLEDVDLITFGIFLCLNLSVENIPTIQANYFMGKTSVDIHNRKSNALFDSNQKYTEGLKIAKTLIPNMDLVARSDGEWVQLLTMPNIEDILFQIKELSAFSVLVLIQLLRPDRVLTTAQFLVSKMLRVSKKSNIIDEDIYKTQDPILVFLSVGSIITPIIRDLNLNHFKAKRINIIPIGSCSEEQLLQEILDSNSRNEWIVLENIHLCLSWAPNLINFIHSMNKKDSFRVWFTCQKDLPPSSFVVEQCTKVLVSASQGIRSNLIKHRGQIERNGKISNRTVLLHTILLERANFVPLGFLKSYEFSSSDMKIAQTLLESNADRKNISGLLEDLVYSARMESFNDSEILKGYLQKIISAERLYLLKDIDEQEPSRFLEQIPENQDITLLGLALNSENARTSVSFSRIQYNLRILTTRSATLNQLVQHEWRVEVQPFIALWKKLISNIDMGSKVSDTSSPWGYFVHNDLMLFKKSFAKIELDMRRLTTMVSKNEHWDNEADEKAKFLVNDVVPPDWSAIWLGPKSATAYIYRLIRNGTSLSNHSNFVDLSLFTNLIDPSLFLRPRSIIHIGKLVTSLKSLVKLTEMELNVCWDQSSKEEYSMCFQNIQIQGCVFDGKKIGDCQITDQSFTQLPVTYFTWKRRIEHVPKSQPIMLHVPIYEDDSREILIDYAMLPMSSNEEKRKWILAGVAMFLQVLNLEN